MIRSFGLLCFLIVSSSLCAQRVYFFGVIKDSTASPLEDVYVKNINASNLTFSNVKGEFRIPAKIGDTLILSRIGYELHTHIVNFQSAQTKNVFTLNESMTELNEVIVNEMPEYMRFKEMIMETDAKDTAFQIFGVEPVEITGDKRLEESYIRSPGMLLTHPIDFVYQNLSKREKEKRKMHQINKRSSTVTKANLKFSRAWVAEATKLDGDELTSFIEYCDFSPEYIASTPEYIIYEKMMVLLPKFLEEKGKG